MCVPLTSNGTLKTIEIISHLFIDETDTVRNHGGELDGVICGLDWNAVALQVEEEEGGGSPRGRLYGSQQ